MKAITREMKDFLNLRWKLLRPKCKGNPTGKHTMAEFVNSKECYDCNYKEPIYIERKV